MKKSCLPLLVLLIGAVIYGLYKYNEGPINIENKRADVTIEAPELMNAFLSDEDAANVNYLDKVIEVSGVVSRINMDGTPSIDLATDTEMSSIICELAEGVSLLNIEVGNKVTVKGQCTGFLMDVVMVKSVITQIN